MNVRVIYNSRTGFTKRYAQDLARRTCGVALPLKEANRNDGVQPDVLIFGSRAHAGSIECLRRGAKLLAASGAKKTAIYVTGAMPIDAHGQIADLWERNLGPIGLLETPHFYLPAGLRYETMGPVDRFLMSGLKFALQHKKHKTSEDLMLERGIAKSFDISDPAYLDPVVAWIQCT